MKRRAAAVPYLAGPKGNKSTKAKTLIISSTAAACTTDTVVDNIISNVVPGPVRLSEDFYNQNCIELSKALLGKVLVRKLPNSGEIIRATIVETEAYPGGDDAASQSFQGRRTERNEPMYMNPGTTYVYFTYGMYHCFNISSKGDGSAVLLRGGEPKEDYQIMHQLRQKNMKTTNESQSKTNGDGNTSLAKKQLKLYELCNGPSKLCMAFDITRHNANKLDLITSEELWLETNEDTRFNDNVKIETAKRIGIDSTPLQARNKPWRFYIADNLCVSKIRVAEVKKRIAEKEKLVNI